MGLSSTEEELYEFIKNSAGVTIKQIQEKLTPQHVGAMGKLIGQDLVKKEKRKKGEGYNLKFVVHYIIDKSEEKQVTLKEKFEEYERRRINYKQKGEDTALKDLAQIAKDYFKQYPEELNK